MFFILSNFLCSKVYFFWHWYVHSSFLSFIPALINPFYVILASIYLFICLFFICMAYFLPFNLLISLYLKCITCRQHILWSFLKKSILTISVIHLVCLFIFGVVIYILEFRSTILLFVLCFYSHSVPLFSFPTFIWTIWMLLVIFIYINSIILFDLLSFYYMSLYSAFSYCSKHFSIHI